jgi:glutamate-5-semialdehyde dehydrogenase
VLPDLARARAAQPTLLDADRPALLRTLAAALRRAEPEILSANRCDLDAAEQRGTPPPLIDRLLLDRGRLLQVAGSLEEIAALPEPLEQVLACWEHPNGLRIQQVTVPFGLIAVIYESRPNVTVDVAGLALRAGSAAYLRGSTAAARSNRAILAALRSGLAEFGLPEALLAHSCLEDRSDIAALLAARHLVDLLVPRGGAELIRWVVEQAKVPVLETGAGVCHLFLDEDADLEMAKAVVVNAKCQRPGVCNAIETLLVHRACAERLLPAICKELRDRGVELRGDAAVRALFPAARPATEDDWAAEYLDLVLAVRVVSSLEEAVSHINRFGTHHSDGIVTSSPQRGRSFQRSVDSAVVYVNSSTRFTDGAEFGFGAELGISTQKLHARGPVGLAQLVTTQYRVDGSGQVR